MFKDGPLTPAMSQRDLNSITEAELKQVVAMLKKLSKPQYGTTASVSSDLELTAEEQLVDASNIKIFDVIILGKLPEPK